MSLSDRVKDAHPQKPGPKPGMNKLLDALDEEDRTALEGLILDFDISASTIHQVLQAEKNDLLKRAEDAEDSDEERELAALAKLHEISAFTIGRFRRQVKAGTAGVS